MAALTETEIKDLSDAIREDIADSLRSNLGVRIESARRIGRIVSASFERELKKLEPSDLEACNVE